MLILKSGITYFLLVFAAGFLFGVLRTLLVVPLLGEIYAELVEIPFMVLLIYLFAKLIVEKFNVPYFFKQRLGMGVLALLFLLISEALLVNVFGDITLQEYIQKKNNISGLAYGFSLLLFMIFPLTVHRKKIHSSEY